MLSYTSDLSGNVIVEKGKTCDPMAALASYVLVDMYKKDIKPSTGPKMIELTAKKPAGSANRDTVVKIFSLKGMNRGARGEYVGTDITTVDDASHAAVVIMNKLVKEFHAVHKKWAMSAPARVAISDGKIAELADVLGISQVELVKRLNASLVRKSHQMIMDPVNPYEYFDPSLAVVGQVRAMEASTRGGVQVSAQTKDICKRSINKILGASRAAGLEIDEREMMKYWAYMNKGSLLEAGSIMDMIREARGTPSFAKFKAMPVAFAEPGDAK